MNIKQVLVDQEGPLSSLSIFQWILVLETPSGDILGIVFILINLILLKVVENFFFVAQDHSPQKTG